MKKAAAHVTERIIVVHSRDPILDHNNPDLLLAHCFGPFESFEEAQEFDDVEPDACYKFALPLVGPDIADLLRARHPDS